MFMLGREILSKKCAISSQSCVVTISPRRKVATDAIYDFGFFSMRLRRLDIGCIVFMWHPCHFSFQVLTVEPPVWLELWLASDSYTANQCGLG